MAETVIIAGVIAATAAAAASAVGSYSQAKAQSQAADYQATAARQTAQVASNSAAAKEAQVRRQNALASGDERAAAAQANIGAGGSAYDVLRQNQISREMDALNVRYEGRLQRHAALSEANLDQFAASTYSKQATGALIGGAFGTASTVLGGAGSYLNYKQTGYWGGR